MNHHYLAFDLGATNGRSILGSLSESEELKLQEITRFPNRMMNLNGALYWNIYSLFEEIKRGIIQVARMGIIPQSIGIDTWGVDYGCVAEDGSIIGLPNAYRDARTIGAGEKFFSSCMQAQELYNITGIQHLDFNTVFQLHEHKNDFSHIHSGKFLFIPDLLAYLLTGNMVTEYTIASTGSLLNPFTRDIDDRIIRSIGVERSAFGQLVEPGTMIGVLSDTICRESGIPPIPVIAVAGHDTASAVAAIPTEDKNFAYLSSGTWSLIGIESSAPVINEFTQKHNITNEGGVAGTTRLLKNITGMWLVEECLKYWRKHDKNYSYDDIVSMAEKSANDAIINPDALEFTAPDDMPHEILSYCRNHAQPLPETDGDYLRIIFRSLAKRYSDVLDLFKHIASANIERLHVVGGGSRNKYLNQIIADTCKIPVIAGPAEATAIGNVMLQAIAGGRIRNLTEMRRIICKNIKTEKYIPKSFSHERRNNPQGV